MPHDDILFGDDLEECDNEQFLLQICLRLDRHFPAFEDRRRALHHLENQVEESTTFINALKSIDAHTLAGKVQAALDAYVEATQGVNANA